MRAGEMALQGSEAAMQHVTRRRASARPQPDTQGWAAGCREESTRELMASVITGFEPGFLGTTAPPQVSRT